MDSKAEKELEKHILNQVTWDRLPSNARSILENSQTKWKQYVVRFSVKHQLRWKTNLIRNFVSDERMYYQEIVRLSISNLVLYPYHIIDKLIGMLNVTPFKYYLVMMIETMANSKSYDELPNFTAVDCLRLLCIGRNQYIDIMNRCRTKGFLFKKKKDVIKSLLPAKSLEKNIEYWWQINIGFPLPDEEKTCSEEEQEVLEELRRGPKQAGVFDRDTVLSLLTKGLVFIDVPISNSDYISVPPLEGFVMNRVSGDYFENLLYKIFVTIDERTNIQQLSELLQIDVESVKQAASLYCRLGFAKKKNVEPLLNNDDNQDSLLIKTKWHSSWINYQSSNNIISTPTNTTPSTDSTPTVPTTEIELTRVGLVFDSSITAFLMMGNLGYGLKNHAVTMFEVGKLANEALDDFLLELDKVDVNEFVGDSEAKRYAASAVALRDTIKYLRYNDRIPATSNGLDLISCERMNSLEETTRMRVLAKNYSVLLSMSPFSTDSSPVISSCMPVHFGAAIYEVHSFWFKLYMYNMVGAGPDTILLPKGSRVKRIPPVFRDCEKVRVCSIDHDSINVNLSQLLPTINETLLSSPVLLQAFSYARDDPLAKPRHGSREQQTIREKLSIIDVPFPIEKDDNDDELIEEYTQDNMHKHPLVKKVVKLLNLQNSVGYISMLRKDIDLSIESINHNQNNQNNQNNNNQNNQVKTSWLPYNVYFGVPIFDSALNQQVCQKLINHSLLSETNIQRHNHASRVLSLNLLRFISSTCPPVHPDLDTIDISKINSVLPSVQNLPLPTQTISFTNGILEF